MPDLQAHVPGLWPLEVANALLVGERRGRTNPAKAAHCLALPGTFPIAVVSSRGSVYSRPLLNISLRQSDKKSRRTPRLVAPT
jgi:hypothetical protein